MWSAYLASSPEKEKEQLNQKQLSDYEDGQKFVLENTDLNAYRQALAQRATEVVALIDDIKPKTIKDLKKDSESHP